MRDLIKYFIKYPVLANLLIMLIMVLGYVGLTSLNSNYFPEVPSRFINIQIVYPGSSPEEIEKGVVLKIEDNLKGITGIERLSSVSSENTATIIVEVFKGYDTDLVLQDVKSGVDRISQFPTGMEPPIIYKRENLGTTLSFAIYGDADLQTLKTISEKMENDIRAKEGISKVEVEGFPEREIEVALDEVKMQAFKITFDQVSNAISKTNLDMTGGLMKGLEEEMLIRVKNKKYYASELKNIVLKTNPSGNKVYLSDVSLITDKWEDTPSRTFYNGKPAVIITVKNTIDENILEIAQTMKAYLVEFNDSRTDVQASIITDLSVVLQERIDLLYDNGSVGLILVLVLLALFLHFRLAFWVALSIPISFAGMLIFASAFGITINVMSLFGMIIVIGILVDDGIVICENIYQHYENGESPTQAAINATMEVLPAVFSAIITTIIAFSTFFFLDGRLGDFARELAFVVIFTLLFSLVEGALILPAHVAHSKALGKGVKPNGFQRFFTQIMDFLKDKIYAPVLRFSLNNNSILIACILFLFFVSIGMVSGGFLKTTFFPNIESDEISIGLKMSPGTVEEVTASKLLRIENAIWEVNQKLKEEKQNEINVIKGVVKKLGPAQHEGSIKIRLESAEIRGVSNYAVKGLIRDAAGEFPDVEELTYGGGTPFGKPISISLKGNNISELKEASEKLKYELKQLSSLRDVTDSDKEGLRELQLELKEKALMMGLTLGDIIRQVRVGFFGLEVQRLQRGLDEVKVWVRYSEENRNSRAKLEQMRIRTADGREIPLNELVTFKMENGIMAISHLDSRREIKVEGDISSPDVSVTDIYADIEANVLPGLLDKFTTVSYSLEGQAQQSKKVAKSAQKVGPIILFLMFFTIVFTFRSFLQTIIVLVIIPFGFSGVIFGHWIHGTSLSLLSFFGVIALIGIMVNDSLVFVSTFNNLVKKGMKFKEAVYETGLQRFRPILLTSVTTIAGLGPLILEKSFGAQFLIPMAISVAYGLMVATILTLLMLPVLLVVVNRFMVLMAWEWGGEKPSPLSVEPAYIELMDERKEEELERESRDNQDNDSEF